ncbi:MAG: redox-sensing transcriptional repressor Rex [Clostridia bacterium]|nr:redox-sensing transcriptional repressor Rex [Clostridia bacterium]
MSYPTNEKNQAIPQSPAVSRQVKTRLPRYYRYLKELLDAGIYRISSGKLAKMMALTASQIRQDLNYFGCFGQQGYGYNVKYLFAQISEILGVNDKLTAVIIGVGNLGRAMAQSNIFLSRGINLVALFDKSPELIGKEISGRCIYDIDQLESYLAEHRVDVAVLTLTSTQAQAMAKRLESAGIRGIWNFTNVEIPKMKNVSVMNVYMGDSLMQLCFDIRQKALESDT